MQRMHLSYIAMANMHVRGCIRVYCVRKYCQGIAIVNSNNFKYQVCQIVHSIYSAWMLRGLECLEDVSSLEYMFINLMQISRAC